MVAVKLFMFAFIVIAVVAEEKKPVAEIITEQTLVDTDGYHFNFKTSDGVSREEQAGLITVGDKKGIAVRGSYSYPGPYGEQYVVTFTADDKGYKPQIRIVPNHQ